MNPFRYFKRSFLLVALFGFAAGVDAEEVGISSTAFAARSVGEGDTLYTELSPERTGIVSSNDYDDPRMWRDLYREYALGAIGTGVTVGDFDGDGLQDVFVVSKVDTGRLFRNLGDWRFEDVTVAAGLEDSSEAWKQGAAFVDVDNDGWLDLYVCRFGAPNQLFMNRGDGRFEDEAEARGVAVTDASGMACFADYDRDGWLDFYLQTNLLDGSASPDGQKDFLFRNDGNGYFSDVSAAAGMLDRFTQGHSATWWDQNEDGWLDLYVANDFGPPDFLYRNNGDGTFTNVIDRVMPHTTFSSMGSDLGDVDNDGRIDFFVADMAGATLEKEQRGQSDSRARLKSEQNELVDTAVQKLFNALYLNTGTERVLEVAALAGVSATNWTWSTRFEDLDNDGRLDLFIANGMDREQNNLDLIEKRMASVNAWGRIGILKQSPLLAEANFVYANRGDLRFEEIGEAWGLDKVGMSTGAAFADFDGDGDLDLIFANYGEGPTVLRNDGLSGNRLVVALRGTKSNRSGLGARVEIETEAGLQVRQLVSARGYLSTSELVAHFGLGDEERVGSLKVIWPSGIEQRFSDLDAGRRYVVTEGEQLGQESVEQVEAVSPFFKDATERLGLGVTRREEELEGSVTQALVPRRFNRRGPGIAVGDLDGDGVDEIVFGATAVDGVAVLRREGSRYRNVDTGALGGEQPINDGPPLIFDANGDGVNDLLFTGGGAALPAEEPEYEPRLWLGDGKGGFRRAANFPSFPMSVGAAVAADFDRDGKLDLFLGGRLFPGYYPEPAYSALMLQRDGKLQDVTRRFARDLQEVGLVTSALASDVDADGWMDLVLCLEWGGVRFFRNEEGAGLKDVSEEWGFDAAGSGLWTSLAGADFNGDGRMDYAVGNLGLNTIYRADAENPMRLLASDFAGSGSDQLVLAYAVGEDMYPVASRSELAAKIPEVLKRFPSNDAFARATLAEILGEDTLSRAMVYEANELRSGVLLSDPSGGYTFRALPRLAQVAPVQGMEATDFDGDGFCDLLLVGNDYSAVPALGRFDGGLGWWLKGDGAGGFACVPVAESGWSVPGNAKALVVVDLNGDGRADGLVSRNNQSALAFLNEGASERLDFAVRLKGAGGNADAIGGRLEIWVGGELRWADEVRAGGGYASQSSAMRFFSLATEDVSEALLRVRWPSGKVVEVRLPEAGGTFEVKDEG